MSDFEQDPNGRFVVRPLGVVVRGHALNSRGRSVVRFFAFVGSVDPDRQVGRLDGYRTRKEAQQVADLQSVLALDFARLRDAGIPVGFDPFNA